MQEKIENMPRWQELMYDKSAEQLRTTIELINSQIARTMTADLEEKEVAIAWFKWQLQLAQTLLQQKTKARITAALTAKSATQPHSQPMYTARTEKEEAVAA